jgi:hypothetical protein
MLQLHLINLVYLIILLVPGVVAGCIVTWHTRSALAIFKTIFASLAVSFIMGAATLISGKLLSPLLSGMLGNWIMLIDFAPIPTSEFAWSLFSLDYLTGQCEVLCREKRTFLPLEAWNARKWLKYKYYQLVQLWSFIIV